MIFDFLFNNAKSFEIVEQFDKDLSTDLKNLEQLNNLINVLIDYLVELKDSISDEEADEISRKTLEIYDTSLAIDSLVSNIKKNIERSYGDEIKLFRYLMDAGFYHHGGMSDKQYLMLKKDEEQILRAAKKRNMEIKELKYKDLEIMSPKSRYPLYVSDNDAFEKTDLGQFFDILNKLLLSLYDMFPNISVLLKKNFLKDNNDALILPKEKIPALINLISSYMYHNMAGEYSYGTKSFRDIEFNKKYETLTQYYHNHIKNMLLEQLKQQKIIGEKISKIRDMITTKEHIMSDTRNYYYIHATDSSDPVVINSILENGIISHSFNSRTFIANMPYGEGNMRMDITAYPVLKPNLIQKDIKPREGYESDTIRNYHESGEFDLNSNNICVEDARFMLSRQNTLFRGNCTFLIRTPFKTRFLNRGYNERHFQFRVKPKYIIGMLIDKTEKNQQLLIQLCYKFGIPLYDEYFKPIWPKD